MVPAGPPAKSGGDRKKLLGNETPPLPFAWASVSVGLEVPSCISIGTEVDTDGSLPDTASTWVETTAGAGMVSGANTTICTSTESELDPAGPSVTVRPGPVSCAVSSEPATS